MRAASVAKMAWVIAGVLAAGTASAAGGSTVKTEKSGAAPVSAAPPTTTAAPSDNTEDQQKTGVLLSTRQADKGVDADQGAKAWDVSAEMMVSHLIDDYNPCAPGVPSGEKTGLSGGCGNAIAQNQFALFFGYNLTGADRLSASFTVNQNPLIDQGDDSFRAGNVGLGYSHAFELPAEFRWTLGIGADLPTGYAAQRTSEITTPHVSSTFSRRFGGLLVSTTESFHYGFYRCKEMAALINGSTPACSAEWGQALNEQWGFGANVAVDYTLPFFEPISVGLDVSTEYSRAYAGGTPTTESSTGALGADVLPGQSGAQPVQQAYGWEAFVRYNLPEVLGFRTDGTIAYALGDGLMGYTNLLHNGIVQQASYTPYLAYREASSVYGTLTVRY